MKRILSLVALLVLVALVAAASCLFTRYFLNCQMMPPPRTELFAQLHLTAEQERKINIIRSQYAAHQHASMLLMQQRNNELAALILADKADSPRVQDAVGKVHEAMGDMQKTTLSTIFAAKEVLTPAQYDQLLQLVAAQLSHNETAPCCR